MPRTRSAAGRCGSPTTRCAPSASSAAPRARPGRRRAGSGGRGGPRRLDPVEGERPFGADTPEPAAMRPTPLGYDVRDPRLRHERGEAEAVEPPASVDACRGGEPPPPLEHLEVLVGVRLVVDVDRRLGVEPELVQ